MNEVKNCLDEESVDEILKVIRILDEMTGHEVYEEFYNRLYAQNHTEKVQDIVESAELIRGNIEENCLLKETLNDLWYLCTLVEGECSLKSMKRNVFKNLFQYIGIAN
mmetsp:Transcript_27744/g.26799  ORF Transcript_27744/g.26799 Transcript_27744/m.26799 type:complete len:108 (+) Transcript_27744:319-642(+)